MTLTQGEIGTSPTDDAATGNCSSTPLSKATKYPPLTLPTKSYESKHEVLQRNHNNWGKQGRNGGGQRNGQGEAKIVRCTQQSSEPRA